MPDNSPPPRRPLKKRGIIRTRLEDDFPEIDWELVDARVRYWAWVGSSTLFVGLLYLTLIRHGLVELFDPFAIRLCKLPGLSFLGWFEWTYRLDLAFVTAIVVFMAVSYSWDRALRIWAMGDPSKLLFGNNTHLVRRIWLSYGLAASLILVDLALMYLAVNHTSWGRSGFSFVSLLVCLLYGALIIWLTLRSLELESRLKDLEKI